MTSAAEAAEAKTPLGAALAEGVRVLSLDQEVTFRRYVRLVLPVDGSVFWVRASILTSVGASSAYGASAYGQPVYDGGTAPTSAMAAVSSEGASSVYGNAVYGSPTYNSGSGGSSPTAPPAPLENEITVKGSLHAATTQTQEEASSAASNSMIFTALSPVQAFNAVAPQEMWLGEFDVAGGTVRFAFRDRRSHYRQAGLHHYVGNAVYSTMQTQIIDNFGQISTLKIVSNSLPIWLIYGSGLAGAPLFPSFAVPLNESPPYITAHIEPGATDALQMAPLIDPTGSSHQLARDRVRLTLYGFSNDNAIDYQNYLFANSIADDAPFGIMDVGVMRDEKQIQVEIQTLAQKKTFTLEVSYYQARMQALALQFIRSAFCSVEIATN